MPEEPVTSVKKFQEFEDYFMTFNTILDSYEHSKDSGIQGPDAEDLANELAALGDPGDSICVDFIEHGRKEVLDAARNDDRYYDQKTRDEIVANYIRAEGFLYALDRNLEEILALHGFDEKELEQDTKR